jgi:hypothetical protein
MALPGWYFGAGGVAQTVWNLRHGFEPAGGINDYDLVYVDPDDRSAASERRTEERVARQLSEHRASHEEPWRTGRRRSLVVPTERMH